MQLPTWHHLNRHLNPSSQLYRPHLLVSHSFHLGKEYHYSPLFSGQKSWSHKSSFSLISTSCPAASRPEYLESLSLLTPSKPPSCPPHSCTSLLFLCFLSCLLESTPQPKSNVYLWKTQIRCFLSCIWPICFSHHIPRINPVIHLICTDLQALPAAPPDLLSHQRPPPTLILCAKHSELLFHQQLKFVPAAGLCIYIPLSLEISSPLTHMTD